jgi:hypothetical protein
MIDRVKSRAGLRHGSRPESLTRFSYATYRSYRRVGKLALIKHQRYAHAHQFKRANKSLRKLKTYLGRVIRDIGRRIRVYSLHAPEVECIGKGKAHRPYEFGVKVRLATPVTHSAGGQFVTHVAALPGNPYDGHTLAKIIPDMQVLVGNFPIRKCPPSFTKRTKTPLTLLPNFSSISIGQRSPPSPRR